MKELPSISAELEEWKSVDTVNFLDYSDRQLHPDTIPEYSAGQSPDAQTQSEPDKPYDHLTTQILALQVKAKNNPNDPTIAKDYTAIHHKIEAALREALTYNGVHVKDLQDIVQDTLFKVYKTLLNGAFRGDSSFRSWLGDIAHNEAYYYKKSQQKKRQTSSYPVPPAYLDNQEEKIIARIECQELFNNKVLTKRERLSFELQANGFKIIEIASMLGISAYAGRVMLHRARNKLKNNRD